jgi:hypothetical protein
MLGEENLSQILLVKFNRLMKKPGMYPAKCSLGGVIIQFQIHYRYVIM